MPWGQTRSRLSRPPPPSAPSHASWNSSLISRFNVAACAAACTFYAAHLTPGGDPATSRSPSVLLDIPHFQHGRRQYATKRGAIGCRNGELAQRNVRYALESLYLDRISDPSARARIVGGNPFGVKGLDLGIDRPAEPRLLAIAAQALVDGRIESIRTRESACED